MLTYISTHTFMYVCVCTCVYVIYITVVSFPGAIYTLELGLTLQ